MESGGGLVGGAADGEAGELSCRLSPRHLNVGHMGGAGTCLQDLQQIAQVVFFSLGDHLDLAPHEVAHIASQSKALGAQRDESPEADTLYTPADPCLQPPDQSVTFPCILIPA